MNSYEQINKSLDEKNYNDSTPFSLANSVYTKNILSKHNIISLKT
jgi:hypothetical protein